MRRLPAGTALVLVSILAACGEATQPGSAPAPRPVSLAPTAACSPDVSASTIRTQIQSVFAGGTGGDFALAQFDDIVDERNQGNLTSAKQQTWSLVDFILDHARQGQIVAPPAAVIQLVNNLFCFVGINAAISDAGNSWIVDPSDAPQILITSDGFSGASLPAGAVTEPTLLTAARIDESTFPIGDGPLLTDLDQYPLYYSFVKTNEGNTGFTQSLIVGVCPAIGIDPVVEARLRLGHNASSGFEITPPANADFLSCSNAPPLPTSSASLGGRILQRLASAFLPEQLVAAPLAVGGIGGSVTEFSPLGPVDPMVIGAPGVGGSVTEFAPPAGGSVVECNFSRARAGAPIPSACRPEVRVRTERGTLLDGIPVTFTVLAGNGRVAPNIPLEDCPTPALTAVMPTGADGKARACWRLGPLPGTNTVEARPDIGGDAVPGVIFSPKAFQFTAVATAQQTQ